MEAYVRRKKENHVLGFSEFRLIGKKNFLGVLGSSFETLAACQTIGAPILLLTIHGLLPGSAQLQTSLLF